MLVRRTRRRLPTRRTFLIHPGLSCTRTPDSKGTNQQSSKPARRKKKPPRGDLSIAEKNTNRRLAQVRVKVEHALAGVKRSRIVKDVLRNTKDDVSDSVMEEACGLHNLRVQNRKRRPKR